MKYSLPFTTLILFTLLFISCSQVENGPRTQGSEKERIVFLVQEDHWFYHKNQKDQWEGFYVELINRIKDQNNWQVEIKLFPDEEKLFEAFESGEGDIMCPALSLNRAAWEKSKRHNPNTPPPQFLLELPHRSFPTVRFKVSDEEDFIWVIREKEHRISKFVQEWSVETSSQLFLANLYTKYFAHLGLFNSFDIMMLKSRYEKKLPLYRKYFEEAGKEFEIDPLFIAAMSYQESHWDPNAVSHTGVKGLMMLTQNTAASLGVYDRENPRESILGGTKYLTKIKSQLEQEIQSPDRNYYALAAYNVGLGHVSDAQEILKKTGDDHRLWTNLRDALPLLSHPAYYRDLKHGKARGNEPVRYVDSIRNYYSLLQKFEKDPG